MEHRTRSVRLVLFLASLATVSVVGTSTPLSAARAEEWAMVGARYQGMGGAGVAAVNDSLATYWNPGALAFAEASDVALPVGITLSAEGGVITDLDEVARFLEETDFESILDKIRNGETLDPDELQAALSLTFDQLADLDQDNQGFQGSVHASLAVRHERFAVSGMGIGYYGVDPLFDISNLSLTSGQADKALRAVVGAGQDRSAQLSSAGLDLAGDISDIFARFSNPAKATPRAQELVYQAEQAGVDTGDREVRKLARQIARSTVKGDGDLSINDSGTFVSGLATEQVGLAYGHPFFERIGIGANVKYIHGISYFDLVQYDEVDNVGDALSELTGRDRRRHDDDWGIDVGLLVKPWDWLRIGIVGRNLNEPSFQVDVPETFKALAGAPDNQFTLERQVRAGVAVEPFPWWTLAADVDVLENQSENLSGFDSRLVSAGTELRFDVWKVGLALRGGVYANVADGANNAVALTGGLGLRVWHLYLDLTAGASPDTEEIESDLGGNDEFPSRANLAAALRFQKEF
ncbi:MAG: conjugal transfer protein TraF [Myxococcota bacterium]